jgi:hypothetical protein
VQGTALKKRLKSLPEEAPVKTLAPIPEWTADPSAAAGTAPEPALNKPVIRAGGRVTIEQHTARLDSRLGAVALEPARAGQSFRLRLDSGRVLRAVALDGHTARLEMQIHQTGADAPESVQP